MEERLSPGTAAGEARSGGEILATVADGVATVTLDRPAALNALTFGMLKALAAWLDEWEGDPRVRGVVPRDRSRALPMAPLPRYRVNCAAPVALRVATR